jgi:8-amino-7-oxononanoate synthase
VMFASGYAANLGVLAAFCDRHGEIFADRLDHACIVDGAILSRAKLTRYPHLDLDALARQLEASTAETRLVATDTVFSMDGDIAPVREILALCERHDAWLLLDDAHGIGVLGAKGHGSLESLGVASPRVLYMATLGKALGGYGAFVAGAEDSIEWLVQRARTYIFSTALPPVAPATAIAAMDLIDYPAASPVPRLRQRIEQFRAACSDAGVKAAPSTTAIQPLLLGDAARALAASAALLANGFLVPAIRPPTVPAGTSRLRVSLSAAHTQQDIAAVVEALATSIAR